MHLPVVTSIHIVVTDPISDPSSVHSWPFTFGQCGTVQSRRVLLLHVGICIIPDDTGVEGGAEFITRGIVVPQFGAVILVEQKFDNVGAGCFGCDRGPIDAFRLETQETVNAFGIRQALQKRLITRLLFLVNFTAGTGQAAVAAAAAAAMMDDISHELKVNRRILGEGGFDHHVGLLVGFHQADQKRKRVR